MNIEKENFNKLKQQDRIELMLRKLIILDVSNDASSFQIMGFVLIVLVYIGILVEDSLMVTLSFIGVVFFLFLSLYSLFQYNKSSKELREEYFKIEVKK